MIFEIEVHIQNGPLSSTKAPIRIPLAWRPAVNTEALLSLTAFHCLWRRFYRNINVHAKGLSYYEIYDIRYQEGREWAGELLNS